jgi:AMMECR1 domain-containing protein
VDDADGAGAAARRIRERVCARLAGREDARSPVPDAGGWPGEVDSVFVSVHHRGRIRGCAGAAVRGAVFDLDPVIDAALRDPRFGPPLRPEDAPDLAVTSAFLHHPLDLGRMTPEEAAERVIPGRHALQAWEGGRSGLLLPSVAVTHNLDAARFTREVMAKAGLDGTSCRWTRWECGAWLAEGDTACRVDGAFPESRTPAALEERVLDLLPRLAGYLLRNQREDGSFFAWYFPFADRLHPGLDLSRTTHAAWVLTRAAAFMEDPALARAARLSVGHLLGRLRRDGRGLGWVVRDGDDPNVAEAAFLLLALCHFPEGDPALQHAPALVRTLRESVGRHGRIATHPTASAGGEAGQDYFPGQVLLALGTAALAGLAKPGRRRLEPAFRYYRHRFRYRRNWGQVAWHLQAWAAWWWVTREPALADHLFEIADWALEWQSQKHGGFLNDHQPASPGFTTGVYLEGIAAVAGVAGALGDAGRLRRYLEAGARGLAFLDGLVMQERDRPVLPNPGFASGGVRESRFLSQVRLDYVSHALSAVLGFLSAAGLSGRAREIRTGAALHG